MRSESCGGLSHRSSAKIIISASVRVRLGLSDVNFIRQTVYVYLQWSMAHADTMLRQAMEYVHVWNISTQNPEKVHVFSQLFVQEYIQDNSVKVGHRWGVFSSSLMSTYMHASLSLTWSHVHVLSINLAFQSCINTHKHLQCNKKKTWEIYATLCFPSFTSTNVYIFPLYGNYWNITCQHLLFGYIYLNPAAECIHMINMQDSVSDSGIMASGTAAICLLCNRTGSHATSRHMGNV